MRDITVTFEDGTRHVYQGAPDDITPQQAESRATRDFGKRVIALDGGRDRVSQIPDMPRGPVGQKVPEPSIGEKAFGALVETPLAIGTGMAASAVAPIVGLYRDLTSGNVRNRLASQAQGAQAANQFAEQYTYTPRTQPGAEYVGAINNMLSSAIGATPLATQIAPLAPAMRTQANALAGQSVNAARDAYVARSSAPMDAAGAAKVREAALRYERAQQQGIPLTKGEQLQELGQQKFESDIAKVDSKGAGKPLVEFKEQQRAAITNRLQQLAESTGAELADPEAYRTIGKLVDDAVVRAFEDKKAKVDAAYKAARASGETKELVPYAAVESYIANQTPTVRAKIAPILSAVREELKRNDPDGAGLISIDRMEDIRQFINKNTEHGSVNEPHAITMKSLIDDATAGAGGELYRAARQQRIELGKQFDNAGRVAKLLDTKGKFSDRAVPFEDVFKHVVLDGSLEEMRTVALILKRSPEGQKVWAELQGQTIQHIRNELTKNASGGLSFAKLKGIIDTLDKDGKLEYMFGRQGRQQLIDFRDTVRDALVKKEGAVNYSNTASSLVKMLDQLSKTRIPGLASLADYAEKRQTKAKVKEATNYNALAPKSKNALKP